MFDNALLTFISAGGNWREYWDMTIAEINLIIQAYIDTENRRAKDTLYNNYLLATNIVSFLGLSFDGKPIPEFNKLYPQLDAHTEINANEAIRIKEQLKQFAAGYNKQRLNGDTKWQ